MKICLNALNIAKDCNKVRFFKDISCLSMAAESFKEGFGFKSFVN